MARVKRSYPGGRTTETVKKSNKGNFRKPSRKVNRYGDNDKKFIQLPALTYQTGLGMDAFMGTTPFIAKIFELNNVVAIAPKGAGAQFANYTKCYVKDGYITFKVGSNRSSGVRYFVNAWIDNTVTAATSQTESNERCQAKSGIHHLAILGGDVPPGQADISGMLKFSTKDITGRGFEDPALSSTQTVDPEQVYYLHLEVWNIGIAVPADALGVTYEVQFYQNCLFYDHVDT